MSHNVENKQLFGAKKKTRSASGIHFGVIDVIVILLVIASVASVIIRKTSVLPDIQNGDVCQISFSAYDIRYTTYDELEIDGDIYIGDEFIGSLGRHIAFQPSVLYAQDANGAVIDVHYPENTMIDINGVINDCKLILTEGGYITSGGIHIAPGCELTLKLRTVDLKITVTSVKKYTLDK